MYLAMLSGTSSVDGLADSLQQIRERLAAGERCISTFHWDLEFPRVFSSERGGFDVFLGNPPLACKNIIAEGSPDVNLD